MDVFIETYRPAAASRRLRTAPIISAGRSDRSDPAGSVTSPDIGWVSGATGCPGQLSGGSVDDEPVSKKSLCDVCALCLVVGNDLDSQGRFRIFG